MYLDSGRDKKIFLRQGQGLRVEGMGGSAPHVNSPNLELPKCWQSQALSKHRHIEHVDTSTHRHIELSMCTNRGMMLVDSCEHHTTNVREGSKYSVHLARVGARPMRRHRQGITDVKSPERAPHIVQDSGRDVERIPR